MLYEEEDTCHAASLSQYLSVTHIYTGTQSHKTHSYNT
jgi:hypothetical protein